MIRPAYIGLIILVLCGCKSPPKEHSSEDLKQSRLPGTPHKHIPPAIETPVKVQDPVSMNSQPSTSISDKKLKQTDLPEELSVARYAEFPSDANFNGKPMTQQIEIPKHVLQEFPDTLSKLAVAAYKGYDIFFPKAIADNFEEGISTTLVVHPQKLIFRYQLFENENSSTPYAIREITIRRNETGGPYAE